MCSESPDKDDFFRAEQFPFEYVKDATVHPGLGYYLLGVTRDVAQVLAQRWEAWTQEHRRVSRSDHDTTDESLGVLRLMLKMK